MHKRFLTFIFIFSLLLGLVGCPQNEEETGTTTTTGQTQAEKNKKVSGLEQDVTIIGKIQDTTCDIALDASTGKFSASQSAGRADRDLSFQGEFFYYNIELQLKVTIKNDTNLAADEQIFLSVHVSTEQLAAEVNIELTLQISSAEEYNNAKASFNGEAQDNGDDSSEEETATTTSTTTTSTTTTTTLPPVITSEDLTIDGVGFRKYYTDDVLTEYKLVNYPNDLTADSYTVPNGVTAISQKAFNYAYPNNTLTNLVIPDSVTTIEDEGLSGCKALSTITVGKGLISVGHSVPVNVIKTVYYTGSLEQWCHIHFSEVSFLYSAEAFYINNELVTGDLIIPGTVTNINDACFYGYEGLTSLVISEGVTTIGNRVFGGCKNLAKIELPNSVTSIGEAAFYGTALSEPLFNTHLFAKMPQSYSGEYTIPDGIKTIGGYAFDGCEGLTSITIPDSVTSIGELAFYMCSGLTSVTIGNGVTSIGYDAFKGCTGLASLTIQAATPPELDLELDSVFNNSNSTPNSGLSTCSSLTAIYVPADSVEAYKAADGWKDYADKILAITE